MAKTRQKNKLKHLKKKLSKKRRSGGGNQSPESISDDTCGIGWQYKTTGPDSNLKLEIITEKKYLTSKDKRLINKLKESLKEEDIMSDIIQNFKDLIQQFQQCNELFREYVRPLDFIKWWIREKPDKALGGKEKIAHFTDELLKGFDESDPDSWYYFALWNHNYMSKEDFNKNVIKPTTTTEKPKVTKQQGQEFIQRFVNTMAIPLTMLILEYDTLMGNVKGQKLIGLLSSDEINNRISYLETYSWLSIENLRTLYKNTITTDDLKTNLAFKMVLGTGDLNNWDYWGGYFGTSQVLGITTLSKGGACGTGWQLPVTRESKIKNNCYNIIAENKDTLFTIYNKTIDDDNKEDILLFKSTWNTDSYWNKTFKDEKPQWWTESKELIKLSDDDRIKILGPTKEKPGIYLESTSALFNSPCDECKINNDDKQKLLDEINKLTKTNEPIKLYIVMLNSEAKPVAWESTNQIESITQQDLEPEYRNIEGIASSGGKSLIVNPNSFFGLVCEATEKVAIAGPSGTAWLILTTIKLLKANDTDIIMSKAALIMLELIALIPHHSIYEILLAITTKPLNLIPDYSINNTNINTINKLMTKSGLAPIVLNDESSASAPTSPAPMAPTSPAPTAAAPTAAAPTSPTSLKNI